MLGRSRVRGECNEVHGSCLFRQGSEDLIGGSPTSGRVRYLPPSVTAGSCRGASLSPGVQNRTGGQTGDGPEKEVKAHKQRSDSITRGQGRRQTIPEPGRSLLPKIEVVMLI